jgi:penicillin-binding protein 1A
MKRSVRIFWILFFAGFATVICIVLLAAYGVFGKMPTLKDLENPSILQSSEVYAVDGTLMGRYYREKANRNNIEYKDISKNVIDALVSTEDERFYKHSGIDFKSTLRAVFLLGREGGGSTITQQLAKTLLEQGSRNKAWRFIEKIKEWIIAVKLERNFTKEEILALYLNAVPFGDNVYGIRNAARTFFQKEPYQLNIEESAVLIGMLKGNNIFNPRRNYKAAFDRRNVVIGQMEANKKISSAEAAKLKSLPIRLNYRKLDENNGYAPYFREVLRNELKDILKDLKKPDGTAYNIYDDGLRIFTTINPRMQEYAEEAVAQWMPTLQKALNAQRFLKNGTVWKGRENIIEAAMKQSDRWQNMAEDGFTDKEIRASFQQKVPMKVFAWNARREKDTVMTPYDSIIYHKQMMQSAFMVMDPITGEVKAWVGGISFKTYKYDHANLKTKRQVGSTIKPLLYCQAMEERGFSPETVVENQAQYFEDYKGWVPAGKKCLGPPQVTMAGALAHSLNCASASIMKQVGPVQFADFLSRLNLPTKVGPYPSNALGSCDLSLFEMMWAYSIFAGHGFSTKPYFISRIEDRNGNVIKRFDYSVNRKEVISEATAYKMCKMMQGTVDVGTAAGLRGRLGAAEMGGKTGTTNDNTDGWFMGYVPQLLGGVWIGCDDPFIRLENNLGYGGQAARPIWEYFFSKVYADKTLGIDKDAKFVRPADLENEINSADINNLITHDPAVSDEDLDHGVGKEQDFKISNEYIPPESKPVKDEKKDTSGKQELKEEPAPANPANEQAKKKPGFFKRIFGKKEKQ